MPSIDDRKIARRGMLLGAAVPGVPAIIGLAVWWLLSTLADPGDDQLLRGIAGWGSVVAVIAATGVIPGALVGRRWAVPVARGYRSDGLRSLRMAVTAVLIGDLLWGLVATTLILATANNGYLNAIYGFAIFAGFGLFLCIPATPIALAAIYVWSALLRRGGVGMGQPR